jgi:hypothetical protein
MLNAGERAFGSSFAYLCKQARSGPGLATRRGKGGLIQILKHLNMEDIKNRKWTITACSAKTQEGLEDGLSWVIENVKK